MFGRRLQEPVQTAHDVRLRAGAGANTFSRTDAALVQSTYTSEGVANASATELLTVFAASIVRAKGSVHSGVSIVRVSSRHALLTRTNGETFSGFPSLPSRGSQLTARVEVRMSLHAVWVPGSAVKARAVGAPILVNARGVLADGGVGDVPWSDVVGLPVGNAMVFRGLSRNRGIAGSRVVTPPSTMFDIAVPAPVIVRDRRARLVRVFVLWRADADIDLQELHVFDGPSEIPVHLPAPVGGGRDGTGGVADLIEGITAFSIPQPPEVLWGITISVGFGFAAAGNVAFTSAGADYEIDV